VKLLGMAHRDIPPSHQVRHKPGSMGCPKSFQFRDIIRTPLVKATACLVGALGV
jgi:hypothetical protein